MRTHSGFVDLEKKTGEVLPGEWRKDITKLTPQRYYSYLDCRGSRYIQDTLQIQSILKDYVNSNTVSEIWLLDVFGWTWDIANKKVKYEKIRFVLQSWVYLKILEKSIG